MLRAAAVITFIAGLPGLGAIMLAGLFPEFPLPAKIVIVNSFFLRGICGTLGGVLLWRGNKWGYYLSIITWLYLIVVSVLTLSDLFDKGMVLSSALIDEHFEQFGRVFFRSLLKILIGVPIVYLLFGSLKQRRDINFRSGKS